MPAYKYVSCVMLLTSARRNTKLFSRLLTIAFAVVCISSAFADNNHVYSKVNYKASLEEQIQQPGSSTTTTNLSKFTPLAYANVNVTFDLPQAELAKAKAFFISRYERNLFYVHTTIHAP